MQIKAEVQQEIEAAKAEPMPSPFEVVPDAVSTEAADQVSRMVCGWCVWCCLDVGCL